MLRDYAFMSVRPPAEPVASTPADESSDELSSTACDQRGCRSASSQCPHGRAVPALVANRPLQLVSASQSYAVASGGSPPATPRRGPRSASAVPKFAPVAA